MIYVQDVPFSREILARSIEAVGISPREARQIAHDIREKLKESKIFNISREGLRQVVISHLQERYDSSIVDTYLFWSKFRRKEEAIIILIGGSTGSGKSTVATEIAHRLGITRIVSTDIIRSIMRSMFTDQLMPLLHKSSYNAKESLDIPVPETEDETIWAFREQVNQVVVGIQAAIERALLENISIVIEGVHIVPGYIREKYLNHDKVTTLLLITEDEHVHKNRFGFRGNLAPDRPSQRYLKYFKNIRKIQDYVVLMADNAKIPVLNNVNLEKTVLSVIQYVTQKIRFYDE